MQELLYEETSVSKNSKSEKTKYYLVLGLSFFSFLLALLGLYYVINFVNIKDKNVVLTLLFNLIPAIIFLVLGIVLFKLKNRFCVDYDYIFVSGSIRVAKVIKNTKRKPVVKFECSQIEKIGPVNSKVYENYVNRRTLKILYLTSNNVPDENKNFYYIVANVNSQKQLFIFECSKTFIINVLKFSKMSVRDEELK